MNYREQLANINIIYNKLLDEESKMLFDARVNYFMTHNDDDFFNVIKTIKKNWRCRELEPHLEDHKEIILYGAGRDGIRTKEILELCNHKVSYFVNSDETKSGTTIDGIPVISVKELTKELSNSLVIISSRKYSKIIYETLLQNDFKPNNILVPKYGLLIASNGTQYFDVFESTPEEEIFVDAGCFNGLSTLEFMNWAGNSRVKKSYAFEPLEEMSEILKETFQPYENDVILYNYAVWNKKETLHFTTDASASKITQEGDTQIHGAAIDDVLKDQKITYIKMDVKVAN